MEQTNYYETLGLAETADPALIRVAYRAAMKKDHPDQGGNGGRAKALNEAYAVLSDPTQRADHDRELAEARRRNSSPVIRYTRTAIEDYPYPPDSFDVVLSSLAFHYVEDFGDICRKVRRTLTDGGDFVFSCEHPVFTAYGSQDWFRDEAGTPLHWPVDRYFTEGRRDAVFLGEPVAKYHKTLTTYVHSLLANGFALTALVEPEPDPRLLSEIPGLADELRRPMMRLISACLHK